MKLIILVNNKGIKIDSRYVSIPEYSTNRSIIRMIKQSFGIDKKHKRLIKKQDHSILKFYGLNVSLLIPLD
jgi:hypothetical protein